MRVIETSLPGVLLIEPVVHRDVEHTADCGCAIEIDVLVRHALEEPSTQPKPTKR